MAGQSIGSMFVDLEARTAKLEQGLATAKKELEKFAKEGKEAASSSKFAFNELDMAILATSIKLRAMYESWRVITSEISYSWKNIETIGGVSPEAVSNVQRLRGEWEQLQVSIRSNVAEGVGKAAGAFSYLWDAAKSTFANIQAQGEVVGRVISAIVSDEQVESLDKMFNEALSSRVGGVDKSTADDRAAIQDPSYWDKVATARSRDAAAMLKERTAAMDLDEQYAELSRQQEIWQKLSETGHNTLMRLTAKTEAHTAAIAMGNIERQNETTLRNMQLSLEAAQERMKLKEIDNAQRLLILSQRKRDLDATISDSMLGEQKLMREKLATQLDLNAAIDANRARGETIISLTRMAAEEQLKQNRSLMTDEQRLTALKEEKKKLLREYDDLLKNARYYESESGEYEIVRTKEMVDNRQRILQVEREISTVLPKTNGYWKEAANIMATGFEKAVLSGGKLRDMLKNIANDLLALIFRQTITAPLASWLTTGLSSLGKSMGFAAEGGPIPNGMPYIVGERGPELFVPSSSGTIIPNNSLSSGNSGGGGTYYIDARGADEARIQQLERTIISLNANVERRAIAAVAQGSRRGGSVSAALAGA